MMVGSTREKVCNLKNIMALPAGSIIGFPRRPQEAGYAMAALLVAMSVMAVMMSVAMPTWSQMIRREKEAELIFRGEQYARAINQYQRKYANQSPANLDVLIKERLLRKKFKDPLSPNEDGEFQLLYFQTGTGPQASGGPLGTGSPSSLGAGSQGSGSQSNSRGAGSQGSGSHGSSRGAGPGGNTGGSIGPSAGPMGRGAIVGVVSKNTGPSLKVYNGKTRYNEWQFIGMEMSSRAGGGGVGGAGLPGGRGGPLGGRGTGDGRGGRGGRGGDEGMRGFDGGRSGFPQSSRGSRGF